MPEKLAIVVLKPRFALKIYTESEARLIAIGSPDELDQTICQLLRDGWVFAAAVDQAMYFVMRAASQDVQKGDLSALHPRQISPEHPAQQVNYRPDPVNPGPTIRQGQAATYERPELRGKKGEK